APHWDGQRRKARAAARTGKAAIAQAADSTLDTTVVSEAELYVTSNSPLALSWRWKLLSGAAWLVSLALLAWVLAYWGWRWFGPAPVSIPTAASEGDWARRIAEAGLFGAAAPKSPTVEPSANIGELRLLGVFA